MKHPPFYEIEQFVVGQHYNTLLIRPDGIEIADTEYYVGTFIRVEMVMLGCADNRTYRYIFCRHGEEVVVHADYLGRTRFRPI